MLGLVSCVLALLGCSQAPRPVASVLPTAGVLTGTLTSTGSDSGTSVDGQHVFRRVISVQPAASPDDDFDFVVVDSTRLVIDGASIDATNAGDKMAAIQRVNVDRSASVSVSYETSIVPSIGRPGTSSSIRVVKSLAIKTGR